MVEVYYDQAVRCFGIRSASKDNEFWIYFGSGNDSLRLLMDRETLNSLQDNISEVLHSNEFITIVPKARQ